MSSDGSSWLRAANRHCISSADNSSRRRPKIWRLIVIGICILASVATAILMLENGP